jgi:S1-C subfamily serine protease
MGDAQIPGKAPGETEVVCSQGTAFAYRRSDLLITCEHVLRCDLEAGGEANFGTVAGATLNVTNMATGFTSAATLIERDLDRDLAVLRIDSPAARMRHFVRSNALAGNDMSARLLGFPNWSPGRKITTQQTTISSTFPKKGLAKFEVSDVIRKGNSGGPVASDAFELLGVAQEGATQSIGNNECLCVSELDRWLDTLDLVSPFDVK